MTDSVHVHHVIFWLQEDGNAPMPEAEFNTQLAQKFGEQASFHACSQGGLKNEDVLAFLVGRNKVVVTDGQVDIHPNMKICDGHLEG